MTTASTGIAGRTNYADWDKKAASLVEDHSQQEEAERLAAQKALGLDGKYARSESEAQEREKAAQVKHAKRVLDGYKQREGKVLQTLTGLLDGASENPSTVRLTRGHIDAGKRVLVICDTTGASPTTDMIVLTQDLSHLESQMSATTHNLVPKSYPGDVDNGVPAAPTTGRIIYGLIKLFISNVHNCTVVIRCKLISGTVELSHCSNITLKMEAEATVATIQVDLCQDVAIQFHDAPSGKNLPGATKKLYWGDDADDRIFSAGVSNMQVQLFRDGFCDASTVADYIQDGAVAVGNATPEECQFVTSVVNSELVTEKVMRHGATTGTNARPMTQRELEAEAKRREQISKEMELNSTIKFIEKNPLPKKPLVVIEDDVVEEVYTMDKTELDMILRECDQNKTRGNEAFGAGEYAQAILLYSLALDKARELPDQDTNALFPRHVVLANRSAAFLKLGQHEKALADAVSAQALDPTYIKGVFRRGLALHAMGQYQDAIAVLAEAHKMEPHNKQIKQALQFAEVRMTQEMRKRMES